MRSHKIFVRNLSKMNNAHSITQSTACWIGKMSVYHEPKDYPWYFGKQLEVNIPQIYPTFPCVYRQEIEASIGFGADEKEFTVLFKVDGKKKFHDQNIFVTEYVFFILFSSILLCAGRLIDRYCNKSHNRRSRLNFCSRKPHSHTLHHMDVQQESAQDLSTPFLLTAAEGARSLKSPSDPGGTGTPRAKFPARSASVVRPFGGGRKSTPGSRPAARTGKPGNYRNRDQQASDSSEKSVKNVR